jgi:hypothetical protein
MSSWIDLAALGKIVAAAVLFGAGLPALFGVGLRALGGPRPGGRGPASAAVSVRPAALAVAVLCFAVVAAAVGYGIYLIVAGT